MPIPQRRIEEVFQGKLYRIRKSRKNIDASIPFTFQVSFINSMIEKIIYHSFGVPKNQYKIITGLAITKEKTSFERLTAVTCIDRYLLKYHLENAIKAGLVEESIKVTKCKRLTQYSLSPKAQEILNAIPSFKEIFLKYI